MSSRKKISDSTQAEVLVQSRRRCCLCFGLRRDDEIKKGQIAHLDGDHSNNGLENLAFLCFNHHDEYDSSTSQSKGLLRQEVERYRSELIDHFGGWRNQPRRDHLLNFLAFSIDMNAMAEAAIRVGENVVWYAAKHAFDVLITDSVDYCDGDLYFPHLVALDHFASWGWLTFSYEERQIESEMSRVFITVDRKPVCNEVAARILQLCRQRGEAVDGMLELAKHRSWAEPSSAQ
jgi:hypothetical protein